MHTVKIGKTAFYRQAEMSLADAYRLRERGDDRKHDGARCDRGPFGDDREAQAALGRQVSRPMNHDTYDDNYIRTILRGVRSMAIVGASPNTVRPSYFLFKYMLERGYDVIPVNPGQAGKQMLGKTFVASLSEIGRPVDMVDIFRASAHVMPVVDEALSLIPPPRVIWMQLGVRNDAAAAKIEAAGLKVVMNRCPKIEYGRLSSEISWMGVNSRTLSSKRAPVPVKGVQRLSLDRQSFGGASTDAADRAARRRIDPFTQEESEMTLNASSCWRSANCVADGRPCARLECCCWIATFLLPLDAQRLRRPAAPASMPKAPGSTGHGPTFRRCRHPVRHRAEPQKK